MYFESHAHYDDKQFQRDRQPLLKSLPSHGVQYVVNCGTNLKSSQAGIKLAEKYDYIYAAVGVHPHDVKNMDDDTLAQLRQLAGHKKAVAVGEIGLDYHYDFSPRNQQKYWFKKQLKLAESLNIPVIIHSREAAQDCFDLIRESNVRQGVIHCYSGSVQMAQDYVKLGFYIGIGGVLTYPNAKSLVEVAKQIPLNRILVETDSPYLSPVPNRGQRNDSRNLEYIVKQLAEILSISPEEVEKVTIANGKKLFFS